MTFSARHKVVVAAIIERDGDFLLHQRPPGSWGAGQWEFPGGKLEATEPPEEAVKRECREELGVEVQVGRIDEVIHHTYDDHGSLLILFYRAKIVSGEPRALLGGAIDFAAGKELLEYDWLPADWPLVERLAEEG